MALSESLSNVDFRTNLCSVGKAYDLLTDEDKKAFDDAVKKGIGINTLRSALQEEGFSFSWSSVNSHIKKLCRCGK